MAMYAPMKTYFDGSTSGKRWLIILEDELPDLPDVKWILKVWARMQGRAAKWADNHPEIKVISRKEDPTSEDKARFIDLIIAEYPDEEEAAQTIEELTKKLSHIRQDKDEIIQAYYERIDALWKAVGRKDYTAAMTVDQRISLNLLIKDFVYGLANEKLRIKVASRYLCTEERSLQGAYIAAESTLASMQFKEQLRKDMQTPDQVIQKAITSMQSNTMNQAPMQYPQPQYASETPYYYEYQAPKKRRSKRHSRYPPQEATHEQESHSYYAPAYALYSDAVDSYTSVPVAQASVIPAPPAPIEASPEPIIPASIAPLEASWSPLDVGEQGQKPCPKARDSSNCFEPNAPIAPIAPVASIEAPPVPPVHVTNETQWNNDGPSTQGPFIEAIPSDFRRDCTPMKPDEWFCPSIDDYPSASSEPESTSTTTDIVSSTDSEPESSSSTTSIGSSSDESDSIITTSSDDSSTDNESESETESLITAEIPVAEDSEEALNIKDSSKASDTSITALNIRPHAIGLPLEHSVTVYPPYADDCPDLNLRAFFDAAGLG